MDKSWMNLSRNSNAYKEGLEGFLDFAFVNGSMNGMILCPCTRCGNGVFVTREQAKSHLLWKGFIDGYTQWIAHGELSVNIPHVFENNPSREALTSNPDDDIQGLLNDVFGNLNQDINMLEVPEIEKPNIEAEKFYKIIDDSKEPLYPGCKQFSKLSFLIRLLHIKCLSKMSDVTFNMLLDLLRKAFPEGISLPKSYYETQKIMKEIGLGFEKYDACPNDCTLYWGANESKKKCDTCNHLRWVPSNDDPIGENRKIPHKVLWHFPLKPRLQRLFMSSKTASFMKWHVEGRVKDGRMRHPADTPAWQTFDYQNPEFSKDPRNVRLGLASDGFNPFKNMNVSHSTWPVILMPYNLPPWMCMKQPYFMLSLLIPGPSAPGNNIDVYLQPLVAELKELWDVGVNTYDASSKQNFQMRAGLLWTISDFPGYATLSGWSTKGELACPVCHKHTCSRWLKHGGKHCYMGHRRFLKKNHPYRKDRCHFDGTDESRCTPDSLMGSTVLEDLMDFRIIFGKLVNDNPKLPFNWKKQSIFFELPYWKNNLLRHCLDVMHIEKNVCENIIGTLLNIDGKSKDNLKSRLDLEEMKIRASLHPVKSIKLFIRR